MDKELITNCDKFQNKACAKCVCFYRVAAYKIVEKLPKELKGRLPSPEQIAKLLEGML